MLYLTNYFVCQCRNKNQYGYINSYYNLGEQNSSGNNVSASYKLGAGFILAYNGHSAGTATWNDLFTITATYNAETKNISVKIDSFNDNYQDKMYGDKRISCDPTNPTIVSISN